MIEAKPEYDLSPEEIDAYIEKYIADRDIANGGTGPEKKTVVKWLDDVNYSPDPKYVPSAFAIDFINFIKLVNGSAGEENKSPVLHYKMLDKVSGSKEDILNLVHRGAAKTTIFGEYLILYLAVYEEIPNFGKVPLGIYVSDSIENGVKNMRKNLEFRWENSDFLKKYLPIARFTDIRWSFENIAGTKCVFKGYGAKTGVRGAKEMGTRPYLAILDDLISDEDARSDIVISAIEDTVYKAVDYALHPKRKKIIWSGTPFNAKDPLYKAVESGAWYVNVYPVCERFPCTKEQFRGSWEDRFTYDYVIKQYIKAKKSGRLDSFYQEMMLRISSEDDMLLDLKRIKWYERSDLFKNPRNYTWYITTDLTTTGKAGSDLSGAIVWAISAQGDKILVDITLRQMGIAQQYENLFRLARKYKRFTGTVYVGVETDGQQGAHIAALDERMLRTGESFTYALQRGKTSIGIRSAVGGKKIERIRAWEPEVSLGKLWFPRDLRHTKDLKELIHEIKHTNQFKIASKYDDGIDTMSQLMMIELLLPYIEADYDDYDEDGNPMEGVLSAVYDKLFADDEDINFLNISSYVV